MPDMCAGLSGFLQNDFLAYKKMLHLDFETACVFFYKKYIIRIDQRAFIYRLSY